MIQCQNVSDHVNWVRGNTTFSAMSAYRDMKRMVGRFGMARILTPTTALWGICVVKGEEKNRPEVDCLDGSFPDKPGVPGVFVTSNRRDESTNKTKQQIDTTLARRSTPQSLSLFFLPPTPSHRRPSFPSSCSTLRCC